MRPAYDVAVIGAGCAGLSIAKHLAEWSSLSTCVLEKEGSLGAHQSGRNSGVVFPGHVHPPGSARAEFAREGAQRLKSFSRGHGVPLSECGQLFVAADADDEARLRDLSARADANGVETRFVDGHDCLAGVQPGVAGRAGLYCPSVATVDSRAFVRSLGERVRELDVDLLLGHGVTGIRPTDGGFHVSTAEGRVDAGYVVNAAGLHADRVAHELGVGREYRIVPFRGEYYELVEDHRELVKTVVYPTPDPETPYLGAHFMPLPDGRVLVGPNAALAFGREAYSRTSVNVRELAGTLSYPGLWRAMFSGRMARAAFDELAKSYSRRRFVAEARRLLPELEVAAFDRSFAGIRAEPVHRNGRIVDGPLAAWADRSLHVLNPVSLTASLAYGDYLAREVLDRYP